MFLDIFSIQSVISVSMYKSPFFAWTELSKISWVAFSASLRLKTMSLNIAQQFMKETVKIYFGLLKIQVKFLIN